MNPRPPKISRAQIVQEAVSLLDEDGPESFSMRRLATRLDVDPMSVYHHVPNKAALFDDVVSAVWAEVDLAPAATDWQEAVAGVARGLRTALLAHPRLVSVVATRPAVAPDMVARLNGILGELDARGLPPHAAMALLDCVIGFVVGKTLGELRAPVGGASAEVGDVVASLDPAAVPHLASAVAGGYGWAPEAEFERGLHAMLAGWGTTD